MKPSTASFIAYDLRPAKQAERRILLDFLKCAHAYGFSVSDFRYVGMGGTKFYDFHLIHRFLGINRMVSLERDQKFATRSLFNRPYDFIEVQSKTTTAFLASDRDDTPTVYWFDYDSSISAEITADIISLGARMVVGGLHLSLFLHNHPDIWAKLMTKNALGFFELLLAIFQAIYQWKI